MRSWIAASGSTSWSIDPRYDYDLFAPPNAAARQRRARHRPARQRAGARRRHAAGRHRRAGRCAGVRAAAAPPAERRLARRARARWAPAAPRRCIAAGAARRPSPPGCSPPARCSSISLLELYRAGVLRRRAYDCLPLERLLARRAGRSASARDILPALLRRRRRPAPERGAVRRRCSCHGVFREDVRVPRRAGARARRRSGSRPTWATRGARARLARGVPRARIAQRPGAARRLLPRAARLLRRAARAAGERARAVRHARRRLRQPAVRRRPGAARPAAARRALHQHRP